MHRQDYIPKYTTNAYPCHKNLKHTDDYIGMRFGKLVVVGYPMNKNGIRAGGAVCKCDCGNYVLVSCMYRLFSGSVVHCYQCGHELRVAAAKKRWDDDLNKEARCRYREYRDERLYKVWMSMKSRCHRVRGYLDVSVCEEWQDYLAFREWAYSHGYDEDAPRMKCTIDRINPYGNYEPTNCRFVDSKTQAHNKRIHWDKLSEEERASRLAAACV